MPRSVASFAKARVVTTTVNSWSSQRDGERLRREPSPMTSFGIAGATPTALFLLQLLLQARRPPAAKLRRQVNDQRRSALSFGRAQRRLVRAGSLMLGFGPAAALPRL